MYHFATIAEAHFDMFSDTNPSVVCESTAASKLTILAILHTPIIIRTYKLSSNICT